MCVKVCLCSRRHYTGRNKTFAAIEGFLRDWTWGSGQGRGDFGVSSAPLPHERGGYALSVQAKSVRVITV